MGLLRTILIILLIYYGLKFIGRLMAPYLVKSMNKKFEKRFNEQFGNRRQETSTQKEGETVIDRIPKQQKESNKDIGEYVDYEEID